MLGNTNPVAREQARHYASIKARINGPRAIIEREPLRLAPFKPLPPPPLPLVRRRTTRTVLEADAHVRAYCRHSNGFTSIARAYIAATCRVYGVSEDSMRSTSRRASIAWPRQVAMYLLRRATNKSLPEIAKLIGGRDHTTVLHGIRKVQRVMGDATLAENIRAIEADVLANCGRLL